MRERFGTKLTDIPELDEPFPDLGSGRTIFVGHMSDIWACNIRDRALHKILYYCEDFNNHYVFQSKNPGMFLSFVNPLLGYEQDRFTFGTTIETNREYPISRAPAPCYRLRFITAMKKRGYETFITIEPVLDFDLSRFIEMLKDAQPSFINIGADSKKSNLPEPSAEKIASLIRGIQELGIELRVKSNLDRLLGGE